MKAAGAVDMGVQKKVLPIGTEDFMEIAAGERYYYVDKTGLIRDILRGSSKVTLFTRPRRFGKTLNMSMLKCFFEIGADSSFFDGLAIAGERELCRQYLGKCPVVSVTLKDVEGNDFRTACRIAAAKISAEASRFDFLRTSGRLTPEERELYVSLLQMDMDESTLSGSLWNLSRLLAKHYGRKVILLIDEYDVPLQKAHVQGYYDQMVQMLRGMFSQALKTNLSLELAVLTGCLRVSKESIFTGLNNLKVFTAADMEFDEYFGFTDREVRELLRYYGLTEHYAKIREWYDGYRFGREEIYCPWDVVNCCRDIIGDPQVEPQNYWANSSSNDVVREFVKRMDTGSARRELEILADGGSVRREIRQELTYRDMYTTVDNLWSLLYMTGYLTQRERPDGRMFTLALPNMEIRDIFADQIMALFREETRKDGAALDKLCGALAAGDAGAAQKALEGYLRKVISIGDTAARRGRKENFYHGLLLGILAYKAEWVVYSNHETGDGYGDVLVEAEDGELGIVIELKYAENGDMEAACREALGQIEDRHYEEMLIERGAARILRYGIACYKKRCRVELAAV